MNRHPHDGDGDALGEGFEGFDGLGGSAPPGARESLALDILLSRAVAGDDAALAEVRVRGPAEPRVLDELAMWQADELRLARAAHALHDIADRAGLPPDRAPVVRRGGLGWAVAAAILLAWVSQSFAPRGAESPAPRENIAGFAGFASSDAAFDAYLEKAREEGVILGEAPPPTLVGSRELTDGSGFEVIVVRQVYERRVMPELYRVVSVDDLGGTEKVVIRPRTEALR
jgi:hypothetical protein